MSHLFEVVNLDQNCRYDLLKVSYFKVASTSNLTLFLPVFAPSAISYPRTLQLSQMQCTACPPSLFELCVVLFSTLICKSTRDLKNVQLKKCIVDRE